MNRIGSSERVREELVAALAEGRGVTAKIRWVSRSDDEGRNRWIHCTPMLGANSNIGVWMIVLVDDESSHPRRRYRPAPPVAKDIKSAAYESQRTRTLPGNIFRPSLSPSDYSDSNSRTRPLMNGKNDFDFRVK